MIYFTICEDDQIQREILNTYIQKMMLACEICYEVSVYESGEQLLSNYPSQADVIFLDIQMANLTGFETAQAIRQFDQEVTLVFVTADTGFMQKGYEVDARRYLLKPIAYEEFRLQMEPCIQQVIEKKNKYIWIKSKYNDYKVLINKIQYAEKVGRKLILHTEDRNYEMYMSMKALEKQLVNEGFMKCHKSFIVNLMKVEGVEKEGILLGDNVIPVGRVFLKPLKKQLLEVLGDILY